MTYAICIRNKKPQLVAYNYNWASNKFTYEFGGSSRIFWEYDELPFETIADLSYESKYVGGFLFPYEYPKDNTLRVEPKNKDFAMTSEQIFALKGFKRFFSGPNIKKVEVLEYKEI